MGTIALENGKSAVFELQFDSAAPSPSPVSRAATTGVTGKVRYEGFDYNIGGLYNFETGAMNFFAAKDTGEQFIFIGTYTPGSGFSGTVTLFEPDGVTVISEGAASAAAIDDADVVTTIIFTGTYGGESYGTWNGTLTSDSFYGTYSGVDASGSVNSTVTGNTINFIGTQPGAVGTIDGNNVYGTWTYTTVDEYGTHVSRGSWSGSAVDTSTLDPDAPDKTDNKDYLNSLILQAWENGYSSYNMAASSDTFTWGVDTYNGISASQDGYDVMDDPDYEDIYTFNSYNDSQTGLTLDGVVLMRFVNGEVAEIYVDSDTTKYDSDPGAPESNSGMTIAFSDSSTCSYKVMVSVGSDSFGDIGSTTAKWHIDDTDVLASAENFYF